MAIAALKLETRKVFQRLFLGFAILGMSKQKQISNTYNDLSKPSQNPLNGYQTKPCSLQPEKCFFGLR
jgi:hypothetical protein